jgi:hypothetical protein
MRSQFPAIHTTFAAFAGVSDQRVAQIGKAGDFVRMLRWDQRKRFYDLETIHVDSQCSGQEVLPRA